MTNNYLYKMLYIVQKCIVNAHKCIAKAHKMRPSAHLYGVLPLVTTVIWLLKWKSEAINSYFSHKKPAFNYNNRLFSYKKPLLICD